jgi:branched-chain amino acid transport system permease protein
MAIYLFQIINGIGLGMIYFLIAVGLSITLGLLGFVNFAHGVFYLLGAYLTYQVAAATGSFLLGALVAPLAIGLLAFCLERGVLRHTYDMPHKYQIIATLGIVLIVQELVVMGWGPLGYSVSPPEWLSGIVMLGPFPYPIYRVFVVAAAALLALLLWLLLEKTRFGALVRAGSESAEMVTLLGVDIRLIMSATLFLGAFIAAIAGVLISPIRGVEPQMNVEALGIAFVVVIIGGMGSFSGSVVAGILIGIIQSVMSTLWAEGSQLMIYVAMTLILIVAPRGLMGRA